MKYILRVTEKKLLSITPTIYLIVLFLIPTLIMLLMAFRIPGNYGGVQPLISKVNGINKLNLSLDSVKFALTSKFIWKLSLRSLKYSII
ncbi:MAG: hypothetical protein ACK5Z5_01775, partial [Neisseriaceae bacterium]